MSAVDAPPGIAFAGNAAGEFVAQPRARRLARVGFYYVNFASAATFLLARRHFHRPGIEFLLAAVLLFLGIAVLGHAVRSARIRIDVDGVRWGWGLGGFRMTPDRMAKVVVYADAIALSPRRGSTWYLARRDWDQFERVPTALRRADIDYQRRDRRAPLGARLQSYGVVLDLLVVANVLAATVTCLLALSL
jgi:hypothetical protein